MPIHATFATFLAFALMLLALAWMSRRIGLLIQENVYLLTGSLDLAMVILFLVYLPGILIHEGAHWLMAKSLGLKTGKFRVWPRKQGKHIGMGSVSVASGGTLADSLVGLAPLLLGSILVALICARLFETGKIGDTWQGNNWPAGMQAMVLALLDEEDGLLWSYLLFAVANAMMPSSSDREPVKSLLLYLLAFAGLYFLLDQSGQLFFQVANWLVEPVQVLTGSLLFIVLLDAVILVLLFAVQAILVTVRRAPRP